ncbi:MAG: hypothetical protein QOD42_1935 [Sphingomonadales bacterium]|jgi:hypothetical protein|nr:hypothetical protein [Sphingomonadales bacterium]
MRPFGSAGLSLLLLAGCAGVHEDQGPPEVPYACEAGGDARVIYRAGGGPVASRARVQHDRHLYELTVEPSENGLLYVGTEGDSVVIWSVNGEMAILSVIPRDAPAGAAPRGISCPRRRAANGGAAPAPEEPAPH